MSQAMHKTMLATFSLLLTCSSMKAKEKNDFDVFEKWMKIQRIYPDKNISHFKNQLNDSFVSTFKSRYEENFTTLNKMTPFFEALTNNQINGNGYQLRYPLNAEMKNCLDLLYDTLEQNPAAFINLLKNNNFATLQINKEELEHHYDHTIEKYKAFLRLLFAHRNQYQEDIYLFAAANRLVEYCFSDATFPHYQSMMMNQKNYPIARFLHTTIWSQLVGLGWKHWHEDCLNNLKRKADEGCTLTYIAGGTDVYQFLKKGIYSIDVIDPFLPSQERYYSENWEWFIKSPEGDDGGIGDQVNCTFDNKRITLKRTLFTEGDAFYSKLSSDKVLEIKKSITLWSVLNADTDEILGTIKFDRRPVNQADFANDPKKVIVSSYDEIICAISSDMLKGWGIDPDKIADSTEIFIKQLRKPFTKDMLKNIRIATLMNVSDLKFIDFASDAC